MTMTAPTASGWEGSTMREQWRYRCPRGHTSWHERASGYKDSQAQYYCESCQEYHNDPAFDELVDMKEPADRHVADAEVTVV